MKHQLLILLALIVSININAQSKITGNISDAIGVLSDANITIKGTEKGAVSDLKGNFEIEAKANDTLSISYLGYGTKEIIVDSQKNIDVVLEFDNLLDEVEVVAFSSYKRDMIMCCFFGNTLTCNTKGEKIFKAIAEKPQTKQSTLYPNPSSKGFFNLKLLNDYKTVQIQVTNMAGQVVLSNSFQNVNKKLSLDLSTFNSGIYIINILADDQILPAKKAIRG